MTKRGEVITDASHIIQDSLLNVIEFVQSSLGTSSPYRGKIFHLRANMRLVQGEDSFFAQILFSTEEHGHSTLSADSDLVDVSSPRQIGSEGETNHSEGFTLRDYRVLKLNGRVGIEWRICDILSVFDTTPTLQS